jgi:CMP-N-acetylneuraminic acid synthetase
MLANKSNIHIPPFERPSDVSHSKSTTEETILYFLKQFPKEELPDLLVLLQATSPLRTSEDIDEAIALFESSDGDGIISVTRPYKPLSWTYERLSDKTLTPLFSEERDWVFPNGALYLFPPKQFLNDGTFLSGKIRGYEMPFCRSIDIDTLEDFYWAETLLNLNRVESTPIDS